MKAITRYNVCAFCARHGVVLDTLSDWRVLDSNYTFTHKFFGTIVEGITDGIVAWTLHTDGETRFVHLDMCHAERKPSERQSTSARPQKAPRTPLPSRPRVTVSEHIAMITADIY
jgi:hypothetical protein